MNYNRKKYKKYGKVKLSNLLFMQKLVYDKMNHKTSSMHQGIKVLLNFEFMKNIMIIPGALWFDVYITNVTRL